MADVVTFDPDTLRIIEISAGGDNELDVIEIYSEWKAWLIADPTRMAYPPAFTVVGGDPISPTANLGSTFFLANNWRIRPSEENHKLTLVGNLFVEGGTGDPVVDTLGAFNIRVVMRVSNLTDAVLLNAPEIQIQSFNGAVTIDSAFGTAGTVFPIGTAETPVLSIEDAATIATDRGLREVSVIGDLYIAPLEIGLPAGAGTDLTDTSTWSLGGAVLLDPDSAAAPNGTTTADKVIPSTDLWQHYLIMISPPGCSDGASTTIGFYAKGAGYDTMQVVPYYGYGAAGPYNFTLTGDVEVIDPGRSTMTPVVGGWYYCTVTFAFSVAYPNVALPVTQLGVFSGDGVSGVLMWGFEMVQNRVAPDFFTAKTLRGESPLRTTLTIATGAGVENCTIRDAAITGSLGGHNRAMDCSLVDLDDIDGEVVNSALGGTLALDVAASAVFANCWASSGVIIDMGGSGTTLSMVGFRGDVTLQNKTGAETATINMTGGTVTISATVTAGTIVLTGAGEYVDNGSATLDVSGLVSRDSVAAAVGTLLTSDHGAGSWTAPSAATVADAVLDEALAGHATAGTAGAALANLDAAVSTAGLSAEQTTMLLEMYRLLGLDPTRPLVVSATSRAAGAEIAQTIAENSGTVTVTRQ